MATSNARRRFLFEEIETATAWADLGAVWAIERLAALDAKMLALHRAAARYQRVFLGASYASAAGDQDAATAIMDGDDTLLRHWLTAESVG